MEATTEFPSKPLLRPDQLQNAREEIAGLEAKLSNPLIQDKGEVRKQLARAVTTTNAQTPQPPKDGEEEGRMVRRSKQLLGEIMQVMCSKAEMRQAPAGAVDKFNRGENSPEVKRKIMEWKNLQLRLHPGEREAANLERHRPTASTLNLDSAQVPGKNYYMPDTTGPAVTFNDAQLAMLRSFSPILADAIGLMTNPERQEVKDTISGIGLAEPSQASIDGTRGVQKREKRKRMLSDAHKAALKAGRERKKAAKA